MPSQIPPEVQFLQNLPAAWGSVLLALAIFGLSLGWAAQGWSTRRAVLWAALGASALLVGINLLARALGWWIGPVFEPRPFTVLMLLSFLAGTGAWVLWLQGYRWLERRSPYPWLIYAAIVLLFIPIVIVADGWQMGRNQFQMSGGYQIWHDVLLGQLVMWSPVLLYKEIQRRVRR